MKNGQESLIGESENKELKDLITKVPSWLIRWGLTVFLLIILLIFFLFEFIKYPDYLTFPIKLKPMDARKEIVACTSGELINICVTQNQFVMAGQPLAYIKSSGDKDCILQLVGTIEKLSSDVDSTASRVNFSKIKVSQLGDLRLSYNHFIVQFDQFKWSNQKMEKLNTKLNKPGAQKKTEIIQTYAEYKENKIKLLKAVDSLNITLDAWKGKYILTARVPGRVKFFRLWRVGEKVLQNQQVFLVDDGKERFSGEISVPMSKVQQLKVGDNVVIKFHDFPSEKFGSQSGKIRFIAEAPDRDRHFNVSIRFDSLETWAETNHIWLTDGLTADAQILIENSTFFKRIKEKLLK
jgi:multidrug resistance efflux pump